MVTNGQARARSGIARALPGAGAAAIALVVATPLAAQRLPRVEGTVVDALHEPVRAAEVWAVAGDAVVARTQTDGEGAFALAELPATQVVVFARAAGTSLGARRLELGDREDVLLWLQVFPGRTVRGTVTADGEPVAGAHVVADPLARCLDDADPRAVTDGNGRYELRNVAIGEVAVRTWAPGHDLDETWIDAADDRTVDVALGPSSVALTFVLNGADAQQLAAARFLVRAEIDDAPAALPAPLERGRPDDQGEWTVGGWPRHVDVRFARADVDGAVTRPWRRSIQIYHDGDRHELGVAPAAEATLRGVVVGPGGTPLGGRELLLRPFDDHPGSMRAVHGRTAADGTFALPSPVDPGERYALRLLDDDYVVDHVRPEHPGGRAWHVDQFAPDRDPPQVRAVAATRVRGRLRDPAGAAAANVALSLESADGTLFGVGHRRGDGTFDMTGLNAEAVASALLRGTSPRWLVAGKPFELGALTVEAPAVELLPAGALRGTLRRVAGRPFAGVRIQLQREVARARQPREVTAETITDRDGSFRFVGLDPGRYTVVATTGVHVAEARVLLDGAGETALPIEWK